MVIYICTWSVSIPHRYGKNIFFVVSSVSFAWFPFLIGTVRTLLSFRAEYSVRSVSIPHRYGKNEYQEDDEATRVRVSIPHRYGKNKRIYIFLTHPITFPFLIGTVRT